MNCYRPSFENRAQRVRRRRIRFFGVVAALCVAGWVFLGARAERVVAPAIDPRWASMVAAVSEAAEGYEGEVAIYIKDLRSGWVFERNADEPFVTASLIKIPIMAATLKAIRDGRLSLDTTIPLRQRHRRGGAGHLKWARAGSPYLVSQLLFDMMTRSDNTATAMLIERLGYDYLNASFSDFGMTVTRIGPRGMSLSDHIPSAEDNHTTAREMANLLERIYRRELVSDGLSDLMLETMKQAKSPSRLARYLPEDWRLARKTGLLRMNCHDVGILYTPSTEYLIAVLTGRNNDYRTAKGFIASVGRVAYTSLEHS